METIKKSTLTFLSELRKNNNREWFTGKKTEYSDAKENFENFVQKTINEISLFDPFLKGLEVKSCVFRINRDIRFSNDKSPYKSNFGAFIVKGGKKNGDKYTGYYIHIEPGKSFIAGGAYMPPAPWLAAIREKINQKPELFIKIINHKEFIRYFGLLSGDKLKTPPRGYTSDNPNIDLLKFKSFLAVNEVADKVVLSSDYFNHVLSVMKAMKPLNDFLNEY
ncbi:MAG: TIGR02453 family protein [Odoribacter sp.]|nr:TIGR02453 family protein [Odoribacter sp.]